MKCPTCNTENSGNFCSECGQRLTEPSYEEIETSFQLVYRTGYSDHPVRDIVFDRRDRFLIVKYEGIPLSVYPVLNDNQIEQLGKDSEKVYHEPLSLSSDGCLLACKFKLSSGSTQGGICVWDMESRSVTTRISAYDCSFGMTPDGRSILSLENEGYILRKYEVCSGNILKEKKLDDKLSRLYVLDDEEIYIEFYDLMGGAAICGIEDFERRRSSSIHSSEAKLTKTNLRQDIPHPEHMTMASTFIGELDSGLDMSVRKFSYDGTRFALGKSNGTLEVYQSQLLKSLLQEK